MKAHYPLFVAIVLTIGNEARSQQQQQAMHPDQHAQHEVEVLPAEARIAGSAIWQEDFGGGWPTGWTTQDPSGLCPWKWTTNGSHGYWNNNNNGAGYDDPMNSTTAGNGFLISDVDSANHFNFGQPSGTTYQYINTYFTTTAIDLSAYPGVVLEFEQSFRFNNEPDLEVSVSNDSLDWTTWTVQGNVAPNDASADPDIVQINISSVAGGQSTVYLRIGWDARVYYWMIDDMRILEAPENDLKAIRSFYNEWDFDNAADFGTLEFSTYPSSQVRPLNFRTIFENFGSATQNNTMLNVEVLDDQNNQVFTGSSNAIVSPGGTMDSLYVSGYTPSGDIGRHTINYTLTQDETDINPANNSNSRWFEVSDYIFARDTAALDGNYDNEGEAYELGNWFNLTADDELHAIDVVLDDESDAGAIIYGAIYDGNRDLIEWTEEYEVQNSDLNGAGQNDEVSLPFSGPLALDAGEDYLVMVGHFGGVDNIFIGTSGPSVAQTSLIYDQPVDTWFYVLNTPMVRMNFNPSVGVDDLEIDHGVTLEQNRPNPANGNTSIGFVLERNTQVDLRIVDLAGKVVKELQLGILAPGRHQVEVNTQDLAPGVYSYSLQTNQHLATRQLVIAE